MTSLFKLSIMGKLALWEKKKYNKFRNRYSFQIEIWNLYNDFKLISFKNDYVIDFVIIVAFAKVRRFVIFLQYFMRSTAKTLRKRLCTSFRGWFLKQSNNQSVLNISFSWLKQISIYRHGFTLSSNEHIKYSSNCCPQVVLVIYECAVIINLVHDSTIKIITDTSKTDVYFKCFLLLLNPV